MERAILDRLAGTAFSALAAGELPFPALLRFLLRCYLRGGNAEAGDLLGAALAAAFSQSAVSDDLSEQADWTTAFLEATALSDDERLGSEVASLLSRQRAHWAGERLVTPLARSLEVAVRTGQTDRLPPAVESVLPDAVDQLERLVGLVYRPGHGCTATIAPRHADDAPGELVDQLMPAAALIRAYGATGRLPYAMLAEELIQTARRGWWQEEPGLFQSIDSREFAVNCLGAHVFTAMAALHDSPDYRNAAVMAPDASYANDAARVLHGLAPRHEAQELRWAMEYGIVLNDWLSIRADTDTGAPKALHLR